MSGSRLCLVLALLLIPGTSPADDPGDDFALRAGRILPVAEDLPPVIEGGLVIVRDGKIVAVGADLEVPPDLPLLEEPDAVVLPGLVAAATDEGGRHRGDESVAAAYRAVDAYDRYEDFSRTLAAGVTSMHVDPGNHRLVTGQGAVVKLGGKPQGRIIRERADLQVNLGDAVNSPPPDVTIPFPASSDVAISPPELQRPTSRMGQILALEEALGAALEKDRAKPFDAHREALAETWRESLPLRIGADRAVDLTDALSFLARKKRPGYVVGGAEAVRVADRLKSHDCGLVYRPRNRFRSVGADLGGSPDALSTDYHDLVRLEGVPLAIGVPVGQPTADLRLAAVAAHQAGLDAERAIESVTRGAAEILGVAERVGSLSPGRDADLVVLSGAPLSPTTHVLRVYVDGVEVFEHPGTRALVVQGETVWVSPEEQIHDGEVLIEEGKVAAVGSTVPHPPGARLVRAGPGSFITPGFIDARGHLGLRGDRGAANPDLDLTRILGVPDVHEHRVARAGITTVLLSPYSFSSKGSRLTAVKTQGQSREKRVVRSVAAVGFSAGQGDPLAAEDSIRRVLDSGKKYLDQWLKYEKALATYLEKKKKGEVPAEEEPEERETIEEAKPDPITGIWQGAIRGGPIPIPLSGKVEARLYGNDIEARLIEPALPPTIEDAKFVGKLDGTKITGHIEVDTEGQGYPQVEGEITEEDKIEGKVVFMGQTIQFRGARVEKGKGVLKVIRTRVRRKGGRPVPPPVDPNLEPIRAILEKKIPAVVDVSSTLGIREVLKLFVEEAKVPVVLLNASGAHAHAEALAKNGVGVVLSRNIVWRRDKRDYHQGDDLTRRGVPIAFQSAAGDGARDLPFHVLYAVERGLSADAALAALTVDAARMYKLDDRVGTLAPGRDGDILIFRGHPFKDGAPVERVFIHGEEVKP